VDRVRDLCNAPPGLDKSLIPHMAVVGIGGMGKTELLRTMQCLDLRMNPSAHADPYWAEFCAATTCATNGVADSIVRPAVKEVVVMFATFGEETGFDEAQDTRTAIVPRAVLRLINDYFVLRLVNGYFGFTFQNAAEDLSFNKLAQTMRQYVISRSDENLSEDDVAVVLCVDELRKIVVDDTRRALLDDLAAFQQEELNQKRRTFIVASSVDLWALHLHWVTWAKRRLTPLPLLPLDEIIKAESRNLPPEASAEVAEDWNAAWWRRPHPSQPHGTPYASPIASPPPLVFRWRSPANTQTHKERAMPKKNLVAQDVCSRRSVCLS